MFFFIFRAAKSCDLIFNDLEKGFDKPNLNPECDCLRLFCINIHKTGTKYRIFDMGSIGHSIISSFTVC